MDDVVWAMILIWFFLIVFGHFTKEIIVKIASGFVGLILMISLMSDNFLIGLAVMAFSIWIMFDAIIRGRS